MPNTESEFMSYQKFAVSLPSLVAVLFTLAVVLEIDIGTANAAGSCLPIDSLGIQTLQGGQLTPFWAEEYTGADLAYQLLNAEALAPVSVAIFDEPVDLSRIRKEFLAPSLQNQRNTADDPSSGTRDQHGTHVAVTLVGPPGMGLASSAFISVAGLSEREESRLIRGTQLARDAGSMVINISGTVRNEDSIFDALGSLVLKNVIIVQASGNRYRRDLLDFNSERLNLIVTGAMAPDGLVASYSVQGKAVTILAPSDDTDTQDPEQQVLLGLDANGKMTKFGGTSGAAPQVTRAIANLLAILPSVTVDDAKELLRKTATPLLVNHLDGGLQQNGAGLLNHLKLLAVGLRLKRAGYPVNRASLLQDPRLFDFESESKAALLQANTLLDQPSCDAKRLGLRQLRAAYLYRPSEAARAALQNQYRELGFMTNSKFFSSLSTDAQGYYQSLVDAERIQTQTWYGLSGFSPGFSQRTIEFATRFRVGTPPVAYVSAMVEEKWRAYADSSPNPNLSPVLSGGFFNFCSVQLLRSILASRPNEDTENMVSVFSKMFENAIYFRTQRQDAWSLINELETNSEGQVREIARRARLNLAKRLNEEFNRDRLYLRPEEIGISGLVPEN